MKTEPIFPKGIIVKAPRQGAPDYVIGSISLKVAEVLEWLQAQQQEWINLDIKLSKKGTWYTQVNTYQKKTEVINDVPF